MVCVWFKGVGIVVGVGGGSSELEFWMFECRMFVVFSIFELLGVRVCCFLRFGFKEDVMVVC